MPTQSAFPLHLLLTQRDLAFTLSLFLEGVRGLWILLQLDIAVCRVLRPHARALARGISLQNWSNLARRFNLNPKATSAVLTATKAIVAGSSALQCLVGEHFARPEGDIDIFVPPEGEAAVEEFLKGNGYTCDGTGNSYTSRTFFTDATDTYVFLFGDSNIITGCKSFAAHETETPRKIQVVTMAAHVPARAAVVNFDYSFVQVLFDGTKFETWAPTHVFLRRGSYNPERLGCIAAIWTEVFQKERESHVINMYGPRRLWQRALKYEKRGFTIVGPRPPAIWGLGYPPETWGSPSFFANAV